MVADHHWEYSSAPNPDSAAGFVYLIVNEPENRMYIGRKFYRVRRGRRKGKHHLWGAYTSSSRQLNEDIRRLGKDNFKFYILEEYDTLGGLSWAETWSLCRVRVPEENDLWYNRRIEKVAWASPEQVTERHRRRLDYLVNKYKKRR